RFTSPRASHAAMNSWSVRKLTRGSPACATGPRARPRADRSLELALAPALARGLAQQVEHLVRETADQLREVLRVPVPGRRHGRDHDALAREAQHVLERDPRQRGLAHAHDEPDAFF